MPRLTPLIMMTITWTAFAQENCPAPLDADQDGLIGIVDMLNILSFFGDSDMDGDGIWDSTDDCVGTLDECGVCNGGGSWPCGCGEPIEFHGEIYQTVFVAGQCWFAENLKSSAYQNGDELTYFDNLEDWYSANSGAFIAYNQSEQNEDIFGFMYNFFAIQDSRGICPSGWHIPSDTEWMNLEEALDMDPNEVNAFGWRGGAQNVGTNLKSDSTWEPGGNGVNLVGLDMRGGGKISGSGSTGVFQNINSHGYWWSSTSNEDGDLFFRTLRSSQSGIYRGIVGPSPSEGYYVRCLKD